MKWFKKWFQEKSASPSKNGPYPRDSAKCTKATTNQQSYSNGCRSRMTISRESLCESNDKNIKHASVSSTSCESLHSDISTNHRSIQSSSVSCRIKQQALDLETLISDGSVTSSHSINAGVGSNSEFVDPDDFFENPDDIRLYREENSFLDEYIIIDMKEVEAITGCLTVESYNDKEFEALTADTLQTTEFCKGSIEDTYVKVKSTPSVISLTSYRDDEYGLFYGTPSYCLSQIPEAFYYRTFSENVQYGRPYRPKPRSKKSSFEELTQKHLQQTLIPTPTPTSNRKFNSSSEILDEKIDALEKSLMGPLIDEVPKPIAKATDKFSVQKSFGLNEEGDIVMNVDHIREDTGCGFLMRREIGLYRSVERGAAIDEKLRIRRSIIAFLKHLLHQLRHPRNKANSGGPGESVAAYALSLAADSTSTFSRNIENFIACTKESREVAPQVVMRNMRQFMSGMKNYLVKHGEGNFQQEVFRARSRLKADEFLNLDTILEGVMHQLVVLPLREYLYGLSVDFYTRTSDIQLLVENVKYASARNAVDFGIRPSVTPPSQAAMHQISLLLLRLQEAELPLEKLEYLLAVVSAIFETSKHARGQALGADDFLPLLVFIVAKCGFIGAEIEAEFMWSLLQQSLLNGEAGYYLTALCSAVHVLKTFMASESEGTGSLDIRSSSLPACSSVLRVIIPDEYNGSLQTRTLPVRPHTTTREVCRTIAHKARITNPQDYGLFKLVDGEETLLMDNDCPQEARLAARGKHCMLAYKRIDAKIAWPTMTSN